MAPDPPSLSAWRCRCGFTAASALTFRRHLTAAAEPGAHAVAAAPRAAAPPPPPPAPLRERLLNQLGALAPPASHAVEGGLLSGSGEEEERKVATVPRALARRPRRAATAPAAAAAPLPSPTFTPDDLEAMLAWRHPPASAKALAASLYCLVCLQAALYGSHAVQPVTAAALALGAALAGVTAAPWGGALAARVVGRPVAPLPSLSDAAVAAAVSAAVHRAAALAAPVLAAIAVVVSRQITGSRGGRAGQLWLALALYLLASAAEARVASNATLAGAAIVAAFAAAPASAALAGGADTLALEAVAAVRALVAADARSAASAAAVAGVVLTCVPVGWLARSALAIGGGGWVLARGVVGARQAGE